MTGVQTCALPIWHISYNDTLDWLSQREQEGSALVIRPKKPVEIGRMERSPEKITALYEDGLRDGAATARSVQAFLTGGV